MRNSLINDSTPYKIFFYSDILLLIYGSFSVDVLRGLEGNFPFSKNIIGRIFGRDSVESEEKTKHDLNSAKLQNSPLTTREVKEKHSLNHI